MTNCEQTAAELLRLCEQLHDSGTCRQYSLPICSRPKADSDVGGGIFGGCFRYNFRREVDNDVISGVVVDYVRIDISVKFGNSRSNGFRDIRGADFVSSE